MAGDGYPGSEQLVVAGYKQLIVLRPVEAVLLLLQTGRVAEGGARKRNQNHILQIAMKHKTVPVCCVLRHFYGLEKIRVKCHIGISLLSQVLL